MSVPSNAFLPYQNNNNTFPTPVTFESDVTILGTTTIQSIVAPTLTGIISLNGWAPSFAVLDTTAGSANVSSGGAGHAVNDLITLGNGVVVAVTGVSGGVITSFMISSRGSATTAPTNPVSQVSTTGSGTGAKFNLFWGPIVSDVAFAPTNTAGGPNGNQMLGYRAGLNQIVAALGNVGYGPLVGGAGGQTGDGLGGGTGMSGAENTLIGYCSGTQLTSGNFNTYVGHNAGGHEVNGTHQVFVGTDAGKWMVNGTTLVAVGSDALKFALNTTSTVAIGESAAAGVFNNPVITGAANNGSGLIRLTTTTTGMVTGDTAYVTGVAGTTEANGTWTITVIDGTHIDLQGSTFTNAYVSGGVATTFGTTGLIATVAVGNQALASTSLRSVGRIVAVGNQALQTLTTATDVVGIGHSVGGSITTGSQNVFVGTSAGGAITTGAGNVIIGYKAGVNATNSANAVIIGGFNGGGSNGARGTDSSTVVGGQAGSSSMTGLNNTLLGAYTGQAITSGANNTIVGRSVAGATLTTGSNNVYIGTSSSIDSTASGTSNEIKIGAGSTAIISATGCGTPATAVITTSGPTILGAAGVAVASLPAASAALKGARTFVTDASTATPTFMNTLTGGGSAFVPVFCDGTVWRYG